jgi:hypothetical protein
MLADLVSEDAYQPSLFDASSSTSSVEAVSIVEGLSLQHGHHLLRYDFLTNPFMPPPKGLWPVLDEFLLLTRISTHGR